MLYLNIFQNILSLSNLIIKKISTTNNLITFEVEMIRRPHKCPYCETMAYRIHDYRLQKIKDLLAICGLLIGSLQMKFFPMFVIS